MEIMAWANSGLSFVMANKPLIVITVGVLVTSGLCWEAVAPILRGKKMKKERQQFVRVFMVDKFTSEIEDSVLDGDISREEATEVYRDLKKCFPIPDLYPSVPLLKERIQKRLNSFTHAPVDLPVETAKPVRKSFFSKVA